MPSGPPRPWRSVAGARKARGDGESPDKSNPGGLGVRGGMLTLLFHLLSLFRLLAWPAGKESGGRRMPTAGWPGPGAGPAGCVGSAEDFGAGLESGNSSLFSPPSAARTPKVILRPLKRKRRSARR